MAEAGPSQPSPPPPPTPPPGSAAAEPRASVVQRIGNSRGFRYASAGWRWRGTILGGLAVGYAVFACVFAAPFLCQGDELTSPRFTRSSAPRRPSPAACIRLDPRTALSSTAAGTPRSGEPASAMPSPSSRTSTGSSTTAASSRQSRPGPTSTTSSARRRAARQKSPRGS